MKLSIQEFRQLSNISITLLGMSGVGKTYLSQMLADHGWFHYSGDYRIGKHYLNHEIQDNIKTQAMETPFLRDLLLSNSISIESNITIDHLKPISTFLGKLGNPELGGLTLCEFKRRQALHRQAEIRAMNDVPAFIKRAHQKDYKNFINDAGGSLCELNDPELFNLLDKHTLYLYLEASDKQQQVLMDRAVASPKPMFHREQFLDEQLEIYMQLQQIEYIALIDPDKFVRWIFPRLFKSRLPRYEALAKRYAYTITTRQLQGISNEKEFIALLEMLIGEDQCR